MTVYKVAGIKSGVKDTGTTVVLEDIGDKLGIGTNRPAVKLDVIGTGSFAGAEASLSQGNVQVGVDSGGNPGGELMYHTDDYVGLRCAHAGALSLAVKPSGNVGVGTTAPDVALDVIGTASFAGAEASLSQGNVRVGVDSGGNPGGELMYHTDDYVGLRCADSGALSLAVKPDGKVGIGTTSPAQVLDVIGAASFALSEASLSQGNIHLGVDSGGDPGGEVMFHTDDYVGIRCANSGTLPFAVKPSGNVGIGTVTPDCMLHVAGAAAFSGPSETFVTFGSSDTTPSVATGNLFKTHASGQTLTTFDDGVAGQTITVISTAAVVFDISATLKGGSTNITTAAGDVTTWTYDGLNWYLVQFMDVDADHSSIGGGGGGGGTWKVEADGSSSVGSPVTPAADTVVMACATSAARYVQLPAVSGLTDRVIAIKDSGGGGASTNNITIKTNASETIDGSASDIVISTDYASITLVCTGSSWMIV